MMEKETRIALMQEKAKLAMRAEVYKNRAKYYLQLINHIAYIHKADELTSDELVSLTLNHFGDSKAADSFFIDSDLFVDLLKIEANRYWNRHDNAMEAILKIEKALKYER